MDIERGSDSIVATVDFETARVCLAPVFGLELPLTPENIKAFAIFALVQVDDKTWQKRYAIDSVSPAEMELFKKVMCDDEGLA